jgi:hypothetical protein
VLVVGLLAGPSLASCSSSGGHEKQGVDVVFFNSNRADVILVDALPRAAKLPGCRNPACPEPKAGDPSGGYFGWTETRKLPHTYRVNLLPGTALDCPAATGPRARSDSTADYAVVYDITPSGRCIIVKHSPLDS